MTSEKENILTGAQKIFLREGFYKTPMDDIAADLKVSKKTIYKHFNSKEEIVRECLMNYISKNHKNIINIVSADVNAVEKLYKMFGSVSKMLLNISEKFVRDIRDYMPDLWKEIDKIRTKILFENLKIIVEQGQKEGLIVDTQSEVLIGAFVASIRGVINPDSLINNKLSPIKAAESVIDILLNGIITTKGRKIFMKLKSGENK